MSFRTSTCVFPSSFFRLSMPIPNSDHDESRLKNILHFMEWNAPSSATTTLKQNKTNSVAVSKKKE